MCDDPEELRRKVRELAAAVRGARHLVVYTGAGISTVGTGGAPRPWEGRGQRGRLPTGRVSAPAGGLHPRLPGPERRVDAAAEGQERQVSGPCRPGWGVAGAPGPGLTALPASSPRSAADLSEAEPTLTHMSIARLHEQKLVRAGAPMRLPRRASPPSPGELLDAPPCPVPPVPAGAARGVPEL